MKTFNQYKVLKLAAQDFAEAKKWYKSLQVSGLANRFSNEVKQTINVNLNNPYAFAIRYREVRIAHTKKFPYAVHYFVEDEIIIITAIVYDRRDPNITIKR